MRLKRWWSAQPRPRRAGMGLGLAAVVLAVVALALGTGGGGEASPVTAATRTATAASVSGTVAPPGATVAAIVTPELSPTQQGLPTINSLKELKERFGEPPDAKAGRMRIPSIGVDAPLGVKAVPLSGQMPSPLGPADVVLYDFSATPWWGGVPGRGGNAVFSGHVDYSYRLPYVEVNYHGPAVFRNLKLLTAGDSIEVLMDGRRLVYRVEWKRTVSASGDQWGELLSSDVGGDAITLITCEGEFNASTQEYTSRIVVRAVR